MSAIQISVMAKPGKGRTETIEQFLARGGRIQRIEGCPDPEGRVLPRSSRNPRLRPKTPHLLLWK
jgi:hypothetical protein